MFICTYEYEQTYGIGKTLEDAFKHFKDVYDNSVLVDELNFYEVEPIEVEQKIVKKTVIQQKLPK